MVVAVVVVTVVLAAVSALWPVEYAAAGLRTSHPLHERTPHIVAIVWSHDAHPAYATLQLLSVVVAVARWRRAETLVPSQLIWLAGAAVVSAVALAVGPAGWGTPDAGAAVGGPGGTDSPGRAASPDTRGAARAAARWSRR